MTQQDRDLQEYVQTRSPEAFARLVDRYIDVVHSAATRQVRNSETAQDVTQAVFLVLAQKAENVRPEQPLAAWLLQVTRYAASNARREVDRRNHHERRAGEMALRHAAAQQHDRPDDFSWDELSPLLDEGMCKLRAKDRDVLVLRYFEKKSAREAAEALGISADAAEKRTTRAVAKLRDFFRGRGVSVSGVALATGLAARSAEAAPAALKPIVVATSSSIAAPAAAASIAKGTVIAMATAKTNSLIAAAVIALLLLSGGGVVVYKTLAAPGERNVQVAAPSAAVGDTTAAALVNTAIGPPAPVPVTFSDGSTIKLVGLTDQPGTARQWWSASGSIVAPPKPLPGKMLVIRPQPHIRLCQLSFIRSGAAKDDGVSISLSEPTSSSADGGDDARHNSVFAVDDSVSKADVIIRIASGPWARDERYVVKPDATQPATAPAKPSMQIRDVTERKVRNQTMAIVAVKETAHDWQQQRQIRAITADGREIDSTGSMGQPMGMSEYDFNVPKDQIVAIVVRFRPYETREIKDVSLRPGVMTRPATTPSTMP